jgi:hypothetical protein
MMTGRLRDLACDALTLSYFDGIETAENFNHKGCKFGLLCQSLLKSGGELIRCPKKVLLSHTQNPLILQA